MKKIKDVISEFELLDNFEDYNLFIDLHSEWTDSEPYQINVNGTVRNIEISKVSINDLIVFIDTFSKQVTVLSLKNNKSSNSYHYQGETILHKQVGSKICYLKRFKNTKTLKLFINFPENKKINFELELPDNLENLSKLKKKFYETTSLF